jgi:hypothetical protein
MIITQARQRESDRCWDMTESSDEEGWTHAIGYCAGKYDGKPCEHATPKEADECYRRYQLDQQTKYDVTNRDQQERCIACGNWTQNRVEVGCQWPRYFILCSEHATREQLEKLLSAEG